VNRIYKYKKYVDIKKIQMNGVGKFRYLLHIPFKNSISNNKVLVIMKNPSKATNYESDKTINNVLKFCNTRYSEVYIMNLFPYYSTNPSGIKTFIAMKKFVQIMKKNDGVLNETINRVDSVIVAWGGNSIGNKEHYDKAIKRVEDIIESSKKIRHAVRVQGKSIERKYPWHPQVWAVNNKLEIYEWDK